jgi:iron(III) transport system substrate-binding protein
MYWRLFRLIVGAFTVLVLLSALFPQEDSKPKAENARTVTIYGAIPPENLIIIAHEFEKTTGIKVFYVSLLQQDILPRLRDERFSPQADVWVGGSLEYLLEAKKEALLYSYNSPQLEYISSAWRDREGYWTGLFIDVPVFVTNKDLVLRELTELPFFWEDMLKPGNKSKVVLADPGVSRATYSMMAALYQRLGPENAFDYYKKLHKNVQQYPKEALTPGRMVSMGEKNTGVLGVNDAVRYIRDGFPIVITFSKEDIGYHLFGAGIVAGAPHNEEARLFMDWLLSKEGQTLLLSKGLYYYPTNSEVAPTPEVAFFGNLDYGKFNVVEAAENKAKLIEKWNLDVRIGK